MSLKISTTGCICGFRLAVDTAFTGVGTSRPCSEFTIHTATAAVGAQITFFTGFEDTIATHRAGRRHISPALTNRLHALGVGRKDMVAHGGFAAQRMESELTCAWKRYDRVSYYIGAVFRQTCRKNRGFNTS